MIRNVVMGRFRDDATEEERAAAQDAVAAIAVLPLEGRLSSTYGPDERLRAGGWSFAIVNDWIDAEAYRVYDVDDEHNRLRGIIAPACSDIGRVQFEWDG